MEITAQANPKEFLAQYTQNSRLSFIGTFRDRLQKFLFRNPSAMAKAFPAQNSSTSKERVVLHADMDCFFVSVLIRGRPEKQNVPLAVAHGNTPGTSEIASCNYSARAHGVKSGMWLDEAMNRCKNLETLQYDFAQYEEVTDVLLKVLFAFPEVIAVEPVSCDECYVELARESFSDPENVAGRLRDAVFTNTQCPMSVGIGYNKLTAKCATSKAKPPSGNGVYRLTMDTFVNEFGRKSVGELPGVGTKTLKKLEEQGIYSIGDLKEKSETWLKENYGNGIGKKLFDYCQGRDLDPVAVVPPKTMSIDVNWGIRFDQVDASLRFLEEMAEHLAQRMKEMKYYSFEKLTVSIMTRDPSASIETLKYQGHGKANTTSKSTTRQLCDANAQSIFTSAMPLFNQLRRESKQDINDLRGIAIKLDEISAKKAPVRDSASTDALIQSTLHFQHNGQQSSPTKKSRRCFDEGDDDDEVESEDRKDKKVVQIAKKNAFTRQKIQQTIIEKELSDAIKVHRFTRAQQISLFSSSASTLPSSEVYSYDHQNFTVGEEAKTWKEAKKERFYASALCHLSENLNSINGRYMSGRPYLSDLEDLRDELIAEACRSIVQDMALDRVAMLIRAVSHAGMKIANTLSKDGCNLRDDWKRVVLDELEQKIQEEVKTIVGCKLDWQGDGHIFT